MVYQSNGRDSGPSYCAAVGDLVQVGYTKSQLCNTAQFSCHNELQHAAREQLQEKVMTQLDPGGTVHIDQSSKEYEKQTSTSKKENPLSKLVHVLVAPFRSKEADGNKPPLQSNKSERHPNVRYSDIMMPPLEGSNGGFEMNRTDNIKIPEPNKKIN